MKNIEDGKTGFFRVEAVDTDGYQRGLVYFNDRTKAEKLAAEWQKMPSVSSVRVSEDETT
jgi:hypothetical protein